MDAAHVNRPRLGRVLVDAGLVTEEQLAEALAEQTRTGRRLGEIVVERGYVSGPALANALATQHGGVVRTEYGLATGLGENAAAPDVPVEPEAQRSQSLSLLHVLEDWSGMLEELRGKVTRLETELEATRSELEVTRGGLNATTATLEVAQRDLEAAREELRATKERLEARSAKEQAPVPVVREVQIHPAVETQNGERAEADSHLMSVPTPSGFVLLERPGPTPAVGTQVRFEEEPDTCFVVTKVNAASELNPRPCAFLERL